MRKPTHHPPQLAAAAGTNGQPNVPARASSRAKTLSQKDGRVYRVARERANVTQLELADWVDTQRANISRHEKDSEPHEPTLRHVRCAPRAYALHVLRATALKHAATVLELPAVVHPTHSARIAAITDSLTDVIRAYSVDVAGGSVDNADEIICKAHDAIGALLELVAAAREEST